MCGEKREIVAQPEVKEGSPPRVRGKVNLSTTNPTVPRITPACAGKRRICGSICESEEDHPRVCGEKFLKCEAAAIAKGSPPRVRGKGLFGPAGSKARGITPACAGKREINYNSLWMDKDHPRVCGEKSAKLYIKCATAGSPPRVRGKVGLRHTVGLGIGITPACAGKSAL